jgi:hypothetical protein
MLSDEESAMVTAALGKVTDSTCEVAAGAEVGAAAGAAGA